MRPRVRHALSGPAMGARWSAVFYADPDVATAPIAAALAAAVNAAEAEMSGWRPDSDLSRLNAAPVGAWVRMPDNIRTVIEAGLEVGRRSGGAFEIGVGDLVRAWGFGFGARTPDAGRLSALAGTARLEAPAALQIDRAGGRVRKLRDLTIDLGGIAKGFGVDEMARVLTAADLPDWLVGIDGDMRAAGRKPDGRPWSVGHERPDPDERTLMGVLELSDIAVATSGSYRHVARSGGRTVSHTMDPTTRRPVDNALASATVLASSTMLADAWATALMVLGPDAGMALARREDLAVILVTEDGTCLTTLP